MPSKINRQPCGHIPSLLSTLGMLLLFLKGAMLVYTSATAHVHASVWNTLLTTLYIFTFEILLVL